MKAILKAVCYLCVAYCTVAAAASGTITSISPSMGPNTGNITVTIRGTLLSTAGRVVFGTGPGAIQATLTSVTATKVVFQLPASNPALTVGVVAVDVQTAGGATLLSATGSFTYTNPTLTVTAQGRINSVVDISWGTGTVNDSSGTAHPDLNIAAYTWVIGSTSSADAATASVGFGNVYTMSDDYAVFIRNRGTGTGSLVNVKASCANMGAVWNNTGVSGSNTFIMKAKLGTGTPLIITTALTGPLQNAGNAANETIASGALSKFDLIFTAPSTITAGYDVLQSAAVTITATAQ